LLLKVYEVVAVKEGWSCRLYESVKLTGQFHHQYRNRQINQNQNQIQHINMQAKASAPNIKLRLMATAAYINDIINKCFKFCVWKVAEFKA